MDMTMAFAHQGSILAPSFLHTVPNHSLLPRTTSFRIQQTFFFIPQISLKCTLRSKLLKIPSPRCEANTQAEKSNTVTVNDKTKNETDAGGFELRTSGNDSHGVLLDQALVEPISSRHSNAERDKNKENDKKKKKKKEKKEKDTVRISTVPCCYGCGAPLQTEEVNGPGYLTSETFELKKKHHQLRSVLCGRCQLLSQGHMLTAVGGHGGYPGGKQFISADQLREKLSHLRHKKVLIIKLVDIVDFNGSFLTRIRDLVGANPIMMVATKVDLLPRGTDLNAIGDWLVEATMKKKLNVISIHLTSSKSLSGFVGVASEIQQQRKGRDVYVLGSANVGKSAFIDALLKTMALKDFSAAAARRYRPIQSAVPGTTLGPIPINVFHGEGKLYDTPGVHLHHRQAAVVHAADLRLLAPNSRLKAIIISIDSLMKEHRSLVYTSTDISSTKENNRISVLGNIGLNGLSIFWGGLVRIDVVQVPLHTHLTMYGPKGVQIKVVPTCEAEEFYHEELGEALKPPTGKQRAKEWPGLKSIHPIDLKMENNARPSCDIAISGLGWVAVESRSGADVAEATHSGILNESDKELHLLVHVPRPVEVFVRPPMPVGKLGPTWYEYSELTEKEQENRPRLFY